jgi:hypothetical protein
MNRVLRRLLALLLMIPGSFLNAEGSIGKELIDGKPLALGVGDTACQSESGDAMAGGELREQIQSTPSQSGALVSGPLWRRDHGSG